MNDATKTIILATLISVVACCVATTLIVLIYLPESPISVPMTLATPTPSTWYDVYFTAPKFPDRDSDHRGGIDERLAAFIGTATGSVEVAIYQLDLPNVTQALQDAKQRGANVRVVTDIDILSDVDENASFKQLQTAGIRVVAGNPNGIMHDKFVVVDRAAVWTGSSNFTVNDIYRNNNNSIVIRSPEIARNYIVTFDKMFNEKKFGPSRKAGGTMPRLMISGVPVESYFSPEDDVTKRVVAWINQAQQSIDFMAYSFTENSIGDAIVERGKTGVHVRGVFEKTGSETQFSEYGKMRKVGFDVWQDGNGYLMHHKVFILDNKTVILGSSNFSQNAESDNDENLLIIDDPSLAQAYQAEFKRVYDQAKAPPKK